MISASLQAQNN